MSRSLLWETEQIKIKPIYNNPNYNDNIKNIIKENDIIITKPEINIMSRGKELISKEEARSLYMRNENNIASNEILNIINSEENIKENFIEKYKKNNINYKNIQKYFK